jgi:hypothetical protein
MDAGRLKRVGGRDEEYRLPTRAAFSWIVLWWCKQVTAYGALAGGRAGTCTHMFTYTFLPSRTRAQSISE